MVIWDFVLFWSDLWRFERYIDMNQSRFRRFCSFILSIVILTTVFAGCVNQHAHVGEDWANFTSFRDIPGVTQAEIAAVEELQRTRNSFRFASIYGTEMFVGEDGRLRGFSALLCNWLSELFEIPFVPSIFDWDELITGLESGVIDFTGELASNYERRQIYYMTDDIAQRQIIALRMKDAPSLQEIALTRALRFAFLDGDPIADVVARRERNEFEKIIVHDNLQAYQLLASGQIDAFFNETSAEAAFGFFDDVVAGGPLST
jgi:ABC-type amino acid transport substrate-binding protein